MRGPGACAATRASPATPSSQPEKIEALRLISSSPWVLLAHTHFEAAMAQEKVQAAVQEVSLRVRPTARLPPCLERVRAAPQRV